MLDNGVSILYQNALLADGMHPDPAEMVAELYALLEAATRLDD